MLLIMADGAVAVNGAVHEMDVRCFYMNNNYVCICTCKIRRNQLTKRIRANGRIECIYDKNNVFVRTDCNSFCFYSNKRNCTHGMKNQEK